MVKYKKEFNRLVSIITDEVGKDPNKIFNDSDVDRPLGAIWDNISIGGGSYGSGYAYSFISIPASNISAPKFSPAAKIEYLKAIFDKEIYKVDEVNSGRFYRLNLRLCNQFLAKLPVPNADPVIAAHFYKDLYPLKVEFPVTKR